LETNYSFTYDLLGRQQRVERVDLATGKQFLVSYSYDFNNNIIRVIDGVDGENGAVTNYDYDALNQVIQISQFCNNVANKRVNFTYDAVGNYQTIHRYGDLEGTNLIVSSDFEYDGANRLTNFNHSNSNSRLNFSEFSYDGANLIQQIVNQDGFVDYSYDSTNQLVGADYENVNYLDEVYSYDNNGNRTNSGYVTGSNNRLLSDDKYDYEYDNEGNLIRQFERETGRVEEFEWDYRNRLVAVIEKNAAGVIVQIVKYTYDWFGRRLSMSVDDNLVDGVEGKVTYFVYDREHVILDFVDFDGIDGEGEAVLDKRYLYGNNVDQILAQ
jgi:hypothetical protein